MRYLALFFVHCLLSSNALATETNSDKPFLEVKGSWIQGALLRGKVDLHSSVRIFDRDVNVMETGEFVFGLGRDTPEVVNIEVVKDGKSYFYPFSVQQRSYKVQRIDGVANKYVQPPEDVLDRIKAENRTVRRARQTDRNSVEFLKGFELPAKGPITGIYGSQRVFNGVPKRPHFGLDIAGPVGAPVQAPAPGVVTLANDDLYFSGGTLIVDHGQGVSSTFIHLHKILVKEGDQVQAGQLIAEIGATGRVTGPHLDWRVNWFNQRLDPQLLLVDHPRVGEQKNDQNGDK